MLKSVFSLILYCLLPVAALAGPEAAEPEDAHDRVVTHGEFATKDSVHHAAIKAAVYDYFHGQGEASAERLNRAFAADHASMVGVTTNEAGEAVLRSWKDMGEIITAWSSNDNPPGATRDGEILSVSVVDDRLAVVLFRSTDRFYDALTLTLIDGEWKIIAKGFVLQ
ncbi:nuclear transport factor 2 family protein [Parvularcula sp. IMCC14364]|uniref:nuclear transport factor 2 family protein n=1 Tax=Parvularcula sp. IMCC14364 TaxID=3067902 RepID=UPI002741C66F|nr:nuclear transport factor 2 family protein [Parvularcula sp. IMCC14364]